MHVLDFHRCFCLETAAVGGVECNTCRSHLRASCALTDNESGEGDTFYLCHGCIGEDMYKPGGIAQIPTYEVYSIVSETVVKQSKVHANHASDIVQVVSVGNRIETRDGRGATWTAFRLELNRAEGRPLQTAREIFDATVSGEHLLGRSTLHTGGPRWQVVLEYPIRYMNVHPTRTQFQVDVGPVLLPDLARAADSLIGRLDTAYIMYSAFDHAEFAIRRPMAVAGAEADAPETMHYGEVIHADVTNELYSLGL